MPYYRISSHELPNHLRTPVLIGSNYLPRYWATAWSSFFLFDLELSTKEKKLRWLESFYGFVDTLDGSGSLDEYLTVANVERIKSIFEAYFISLTNVEAPNSNTEMKWKTCYEFVNSILLLTIKNNSNQSIDNLEINRHLLVLGHLYGRLKFKKGKSSHRIRSLPAIVIQSLEDMLSPGCVTNPFKSESTQWRIYLIYTLLLKLGLRRGELLLLKMDVVKTEYDSKTNKKRFWINVRLVLDDEEIEDNRASKPSIKTIDSIRQIPISEQTAKLIHHYVINFRGKPNHPFLLNSQWNTPISHESITSYFRKISLYLPDTIKKALDDYSGETKITPHFLRHTSVCVRINQLIEIGDSMDVALQKLRSYFGWSKTSIMPLHYSRAVFQDRLSEVWSNVFDDHVDFIRNLKRFK